MEAAQKLKANLKLENKPCGWCQSPLAIGDDAAVCTACTKEHHARCWDGKAGCSTNGCVNAPLKQLEPTPGVPGHAQGLPPGIILCPQCRNQVNVALGICPFCKAITSPDGLYHGPKTTAKEATQALVFAIIGFIICGVVFGPLAIWKANQAKRAIQNDPSLQGEGMATAGLVIGIIDLIGWAIIMLARFGSHH
jgi:hypothetical protein